MAVHSNEQFRMKHLEFGECSHRMKNWLAIYFLHIHWHTQKNEGNTFFDRSPFDWDMAHICQIFFAMHSKMQLTCSTYCCLPLWLLHFCNGKLNIKKSWLLTHGTISVEWREELMQREWFWMLRTVSCISPKLYLLDIKETSYDLGMYWLYFGFKLQQIVFKRLTLLWIQNSRCNHLPSGNLLAARWRL